VNALKDLQRSYEINGDHLWIKRFIGFQQTAYPLNPKNNAHLGILRLLEAKSGFSANVDRVLNGEGLVSPYGGADGTLFDLGAGQGLGRGPSNVTYCNGKGNSKELPNDDLEKVLKRLNELREKNWQWSRYIPITSKSKKNTEHITALLKDGVAVDDLIVVLEWKAAMDGGHEESRKYFNCITPFRPKHWENNIALASDWDAKGRPLKPSSNGSRKPGEWTQAERMVVPHHDASVYDQGRKGGVK